MRRKTIQLAKNTLVVSLPHQWVKEYNIQKGEEINIDQQAHTLLLSTENCASPNSVKADLSGYNLSLFWYTIGMLYREGHEEIILNFDAETKTKAGNKKTIDQIKHIVDTLIGMEILRFGKTFCVLKEVSHARPEEFANLWRKLFFTVIDMCDDLHAAKSKEDFRVITAYTEDSVNKMTNFAIRILHQKSPYNQAKTLRMLHLLESIEQIADLLSMYAKEEKQPERLLELHELLKHLFCHIENPKKETLKIIYQKKNKLETEMKHICDLIMQAAAWVVPI